MEAAMEAAFREDGMAPRDHSSAQRTERTTFPDLPDEGEVVLEEEEVRSQWGKKRRPALRRASLDLLEIR